MSKKALAIATSSLVLAAMPVVGVFAVDTTEVTDNITVTVPETCTLGEVSTKEVSAEISNGNTNTSMAGNTLSITCNDGTGWHLTAEGAGSGADKTQLINGEFNIPTGVQETYQGWAAVPATATTVAKGESAVSENSITITYGVGIDADQEAGTYKGAVKYVLAKTAGDE